MTSQSGENGAQSDVLSLDVFFLSTCEQWFSLVINLNYKPESILALPIPSSHSPQDFE